MIKLSYSARPVALVLSALCLFAQRAKAQLCDNPDKFLGNITTSYQIDYGSEKFHTLWNEITPENETKWDQIEGNRRGYFNWTNSDRICNYAKQHGFPFKFHTLVWGSQYPKWMDNLSKDEQLKAIEEWMDAVKKRYPDLQMIDVVNEAIDGHNPAPYKEALGGNGQTGYDWVVRAFEMAYERWPDAILIYNDFNTFQWNTDQFIDLVRTLRDAGAPIDAYGCQSHDLTGCNINTFKTSMTKIQNALRIPMYITEYDIGTDDDAFQLQCYKEQLPVMWEADYCAGVTLWGYIYGHTWTDNGNSGLIRDGKDRPAMTWLREYMKTDAARQAKSPFPGMAKEASLYVRPATLRPPLGEPLPIEVRARLRTKTIERVELYVNNKLLSTMTEAPFEAEYTPTAKGVHALKAVLVATDGTRYERYSRFTCTTPLVPGDSFASVSQLEGQTFAIVSNDTQKALYGSGSQNLGYADYATAFADANAGYLFKAEGITVGGSKYYLLRLVTPEGGEYSIWGSPGYLNSQQATGWCSFILGLNNQNGQDIENGAVWDIQSVSGKGFTLRNVGTGLYLAGNGAANSQEPVCWNLCRLKEGTASGIAGVTVSPYPSLPSPLSATWFDLSGRRVDKPGKGIYIVGGKKVVVR